MKLSQFEYNLPEELIAQSPAEPRDSSRLLVINRQTKSLLHKHFSEIVDLLGNKDVLVFNQSKVFPARLIGEKQTGGKVEILLLENTDINKNQWSAMRRGKVQVNQTLIFGEITAIVTSVSEHTIEIRFSCSKDELALHIQKHGLTPLPPYIKGSDDEMSLRKKYQTVYAQNTGSVAAPTAGLHFTLPLLEKLKEKGVQIEYVTLHVGLGTFLPIKENDIANHQMHTERFTIEKDTLERLNIAKQEGKRIIAVGTTTVRVLETLSNTQGNLTPNTREGGTNIYIYPPYKFKFVDALVTNFHLPHSTLLALVSAFVSKPNTAEEFIDFSTSLIGKAYKEAIEKRYRFFSFGDASLIF